MWEWFQHIGRKLIWQNSVNAVLVFEGGMGVGGLSELQHFDLSLQKGFDELHFDLKSGN